MYTPGGRAASLSPRYAPGAMKIHQSDGRLAMAFRSVPILFGLFLLANVGAIVLLGRCGGRARGERLAIEFQAPCGSQAADVLRARVEAMGLGRPEWTVEADRVRLVATLPGLDDDRTAVPALLARPGRLEVRGPAGVLATEADLVEVRVELDEGGMPVDQLVFASEAAARLAAAIDADHAAFLVFVLDGEELARRPNTIRMEDNALRVISGDGPTRDRMRRAVDRALLLKSGPLACPVTVASVEAAG